jgi:hypothetical protein
MKRQFYGSGEFEQTEIRPVARHSTKEPDHEA